MISVPIATPATKNQCASAFRIGLQRRYVGSRQHVCVGKKHDLVLAQLSARVKARKRQHINGQMTLRQGLIYTELVGLPMFAGLALNAGMRFIVKIIKDRSLRYALRAGQRRRETLDFFAERLASGMVESVSAALAASPCSL